jgi:hypothetical protein
VVQLLNGQIGTEPCGAVAPEDAAGDTD